MAGKKILIVDDSNSIRQSTAFVLSGSGYTVSEAEDGQTALDLIKEEKFHLVVTDINMPKLDGITLIKKAREQEAYKFTPILVLTTESQNEKMDEGKKAGATGWIVKPFTADKLLAVVKKVLGD